MTRKNLKVLNLGQNFDITDVGVGALAELTNLTHINLAHTNITDDGLMKLTALKNLTSVAIKGCRYVSKSGWNPFNTRCLAYERWRGWTRTFA